MTEQWATYATAHLDTGVNIVTIRTWARRGVIKKKREGGIVYVDLHSVRVAERDMRLNGARPGRARIGS